MAWDQGFSVTLVSIQREGESFGRSQHAPAADCTVPTERQRENIVAMGGWAAELSSGEADEGTYDSADMSCLLIRLDEHAPSRLTIELDWAEQESQRIVSANLDRVERALEAAGAFRCGGDPGNHRRPGGGLAAGFK